MNNIILNISVTAIITAVFKMLVPDERHGKQIKLLISCFFIISVINIFSNNSKIFNLNEYIDINTNYENYDVIIRRQTADETANALRERIKIRLAEEGISPEKIYIDINISENNSISISKIRLVFENINTYEAERAVEVIEKCTEYEIEVELEEG